jgi:hypothetical protein
MLRAFFRNLFNSSTKELGSVVIRDRFNETEKLLRKKATSTAHSGERNEKLQELISLLEILTKVVNGY